MKIVINDKWAALVKDDTLVQNSNKTYTVEFEFDESWDGFSRTAVFEAGQASVAVVLTEDQCAIPSDCLKQGGVNLRIGVYGVKDAVKKAAIWCNAGRVLFNSNACQLVPSGPSAPSTSLPDDIYSQIIGVIGDLNAAGFEGKTLVEVIIEMRNSISGTATDEEVDDVLNDAFGQKPNLPETPGGDGGLDNTATDEEVVDILNEVFGK